MSHVTNFVIGNVTLHITLLEMLHVTHSSTGNVARYRLCYWKCCTLHTAVLEMLHVTDFVIGNVAFYTLRY